MGSLNDLSNSAEITALFLICFDFDLGLFQGPVYSAWPGVTLCDTRRTMQCWGSNWASLIQTTHIPALKSHLPAPSSLFKMTSGYVGVVDSWYSNPAPTSTPKFNGCPLLQPSLVSMLFCLGTPSTYFRDTCLLFWEFP